MSISPKASARGTVSCRQGLFLLPPKYAPPAFSPLAWSEPFQQSPLHRCDRAFVGRWSQGWIEQKEYCLTIYSPVKSLCASGRRSHSGIGTDVKHPQWADSGSVMRSFRSTAKDHIRRISVNHPSKLPSATPGTASGRQSHGVWTIYKVWNSDQTQDPGIDRRECCVH